MFFLQVSFNMAQRITKKKAIKKSALKFRESGWSLPAPNEPSREYDSFTDPYCPWALAIQYNLHSSYKASELLENGQAISENEAIMRASEATVQSIEPLREKINKDRWTLPTMPRKVKPATKISHTKALLSTNKCNSRSESSSSSLNSRSVTPKTATGRRDKQEQDINNKTTFSQSNNNQQINETYARTSDGRKTTPSSINRPLNMSWQESSASADAEIACLKYVIRRESLLKDLHDALNIPIEFFQGDNDDDLNSIEQCNKLEEGLNDINMDSIAPNSVLMSLLGLLRNASLECVEAIVRWRNACIKDDLTLKSDVGLQHGKRTFMYHNINYLLKMVSDLDFISLVPHVVDVVLTGEAKIRENKKTKKKNGGNRCKSIEPNGNPFLSNIDPLINRTYALERACTDEEREYSSIDLDPLGIGYDVLRLREAEAVMLIEVKQANIDAEREASCYDPLTTEQSQSSQHQHHHNHNDDEDHIHQPQSQVNERKINKKTEEIQQESPTLPPLMTTTNNDSSFPDTSSSSSHLQQPKPITTTNDNDNDDDGGGGEEKEIRKKPWTIATNVTPRKLTQSRIANMKRDGYELSQTIGQGETELNVLNNKLNHLKLSIEDIELKLKKNLSSSSSSKKQSFQSHLVSKNIRSLGARKEFFLLKYNETENSIRKLRGALCLDKLELRRIRRLQKSHEKHLNEINNTSLNKLNHQNESSSTCLVMEDVEVKTKSGLLSSINITARDFQEEEQTQQV